MWAVDRKQGIGLPGDHTMSQSLDTIDGYGSMKITRKKHPGFVVETSVYKLAGKVQPYCPTFQTHLIM